LPDLTQYILINYLCCCEVASAQCEALAAELDQAMAERDSLSLQLAMSEDARESAEAQSVALRRAPEVCSAPAHLFAVQQLCTVLS